MELVLTASVTIFLVTILSWMENKTAYGQQKPWKRQLVAGILLGISACIASDYGTNINGAICNVRDAAPLSAGLMFGPNAGVIAGLIGGIYRFFWGAPIQQVFSAEWLSVMFLPTSPGGFTRLACTFGTIAAGIFGALAREYLFEDKRPSWLGSCALGITIEIFHMILVFVFRLDAMQQGYVILRQVIVPMVLGNGITVMLAALLCAWFSGDQVFPSLRGKNLTTAFRNGLLACILSAFVVTTFGMYIMQKRLGLRQTEASLSRNLSDLKRKIEDDGGIESFIENDFTWHIGSNGGIIVCDVVNNPQGEMDYMRVVLNGKQYNKNQIIDVEQMNRQQVNKMPENFFESTLPIDGEDVPVYGMYEYIDGYIVITYVPIEEATIFQNVTWLLTVCFDILLFASIFINIFVLIRRLILRNIDKINEKLSEITSGNLDTVVDVHSHNEFELLSKDINETVARLKQYIQEAEERIDQELEFARTIQHSALPSVFPAYPNRHDFDIFASMDPAKEVGGDFYDFYPTGKHKMVFLVADVSGKGIPAAMFMMTAKTFLKSYAELGSSPDKVLDITNEKLCETNEAGMFVTCFMCEADLKTGKVHFANAGHNPPLLYHRGEGFRYLKPKRGFVLAGMEGIRYHDQEFDMAPGDYVFLYTDGVTEATNANNELYGEQRLLNILNARSYKNAEEICQAVKEDVELFAGEADQFDDITMLCFRYLGDSGVPTIRFDETKLEDIPEITEFVESELEKIGCPVKTVYQMNIAVDEICSNIIKYAYPKKPGSLTVTMFEKKYPHTLAIRFEDEGIPYNPLTKEDPDVTLSAEERQIGGLGIYMVRKMMDDVRYKYENDRNILTIYKKLDE